MIPLIGLSATVARRNLSLDRSGNWRVWKKLCELNHQVPPESSCFEAIIDSERDACSSDENPGPRLHPARMDLREREREDRADGHHAPDRAKPEQPDREEA